MISKKVSKRYALGLLSVANETATTETIKTEAIDFLALLKDSKDLRDFFKSPVIDKRKKRQIVDEIFVSKSKLFNNFIKLVINQGREDSIKQIFSDFLTELNESKGIFKASLTTAVALPSSTINQIVSNTKILLNLNCEFDLTQNIDEEIIGGYKMRVMDKSIDSSLDSKLKNLKKDFSKNYYEAQI